MFTCDSSCVHLRQGSDRVIQHKHVQVIVRYERLAVEARHSLMADVITILFHVHAMCISLNSLASLPVIGLCDAVWFLGSSFAL